MKDVLEKNIHQNLGFIRIIGIDDYTMILLVVRIWICYYRDARV